MAYTTIDNPELYFQTKLYAGNNGTQSITLDGSENMRPDWVWIKPRNGSDGHVLIDSVRGVLKRLRTEGNNAEDTLSNSLTSFDNDGFTLGNSGEVNSSSYNLVSWNWSAGGSASSNTDGSITSSVSANTTAGFSIVSYTGTGSQATVGHGLGATPKLIIVKRLQNTEDWAVYHASNGAGTYQSLNTTEAKTSNANRFNVAPTSSVFTVNTHESVNFAENYIAYCFAEKKGYSKFGSYTGNGNADGTFIYTGFKPAFFITKRTNTSASWSMWDNKRGINGDIKVLYPDLSNTENNGDYMDFVSNGIKLRDGNSKWGASGDTYIYMAFAENPFVTSSGVPACAR